MALLYLVFWGATFVIFYHLTRFGIGVQPKRFAAAFFLGSVVLFGISLVFAARFDFNSLFS
ncbi:MAG: hypothetical protein A3D49_00955 [Candidatus Zambryskibacteria bacterium RIFCSPHIGHO2_02_FULL_43_37]|uniref:Cytochrome c assembly protein domain-containing protein n=1 Tax=Candidatus Zambryskibacteria bacterium RIFCSPHIGHO2_02_FULL_43_37 TaxID=1802749 RepID=A0A1G2TGM4_9BACT|nr:MAG: hypothetical protein A3D49_00955 [Candidatus Zambryskibacteria bacterium RIFCSPHIGHO2_02_FULL_43_37]